MNDKEQELQEENMKTQQLKLYVDVFITPSIQSNTYKRFFLMLHRNQVYSQYFLSFVICGNTHSVFTPQRAAHSQRCQLPSWR